MMAASQGEVGEHLRFMEARQPTDALHSLLDAAVGDVINNADSVAAQALTHIGEPSNSAAIMQEIVRGYISKVKNVLHNDTCVLMLLQVANDPALRSILDPQRITRQYDPTIFILQRGPCRFGREGVAVFIPLVKVGELEITVESSESTGTGSARYKLNLELKMVTLLSPDSNLMSHGDGKLFCCVAGFEQSMR